MVSGLHLRYAIEKRLFILLDGTFAIGRAEQHICLSRNYDVTIYLFSKSLLAYFKSRENVCEVTKQYGESISVHVILKDYNNEVATIVPDI